MSSSSEEPKLSEYSPKVEGERIGREWGRRERERYHINTYMTVHVCIITKDCS